jgi:hypothetical protein
LRATHLTSLVAASIALAAVGCSSDSGQANDAATPAPAASSPVTEPGTSPAADPGVSPAASVDPDDPFGFGDDDATAVVTIGDERYEFSMATETIGSTTYLSVCQELFGLIQADGHATDGRAITVAIMIPPLDWDSYEDERYDPPRIVVDIDDPYARWVADADWAFANGVDGQSQVDAYEKDGLYAAGSATFMEESALFQSPPGVPVLGTFEVRCADAE